MLVASLGLVTMATGATADRNYGAIVTDTAGLNDRSFNFLANKGRLKAQKQLGMTTRFHLEDDGRLPAEPRRGRGRGW